MRPVIGIRSHRQKAIFPDGERVLLPPLITALNRGLKTAIPHSMRRKVLIPRWALWPNKPTTIATATGNTKSN
jgi:hypothetical protein